VTNANGFVVRSVAALSPTDAWAVGDDESTGHQLTMTEHWDGTRWTVVPSPSPGGSTQANDLADVTAASGNDVWVTGSSFTRTTQFPFVLHWNGSSWAGIRLPVTGVLATDDVPESISAAAGGQAWVSGFAGFLEHQPLTPLAVPVPVVPEVLGELASAANSNLTAAGLTGTQIQTTGCPPSAFGEVVNQNPFPGHLLTLGQAVTLTVCAALVTVPDVTGDDDASARNAITSAGLRVGTVTLTPDCTNPRGTVLSQSPDGGTKVQSGSSVSLNEATRSGRATHQIAPRFCTQ